MGKIRVLPLHEAQKIAAGEIVERPANVVKELFENALDAGATHITLRLKEGGKKSLICIDNGCGMEQDDARLAIHNHATSKLRSVDELETISTFGFRGEALASIAAVSTMTLTTKMADMAEGIRLTVQAGMVLKEESVGCNTGTVIEVHDLFYNLPVRHKFLKKDETEWNVIYHLFQALCLSHQSISCSLYHNDSLIINAPATQSLQERIAQVCDSHFAAKTIPSFLEQHKNGISLTGVISHPSYSRYDRNHLFFFVNNRWIKNQKLAQAFIKAYASMLPERRYPAGVVMIELDPMLVDVNIHPRKEEVQFLHPRIIESAIETMVHQALQKSVSTDLGVLPSAAGQSAHHKTHLSSTTPPQSLFSFKENTPTRMWQFGSKAQPAQPHVIAQKEHEFDAPPTKEIDTQQAAIPKKQISIEEHLFEYRLIGQLHKTYILIETSEGIVLIDQHAAHERILYELFAKRFDEVATVQLMFPSLIQISNEEHALLKPWFSIFKDQGIFLDELKEGTLMVKSLPVLLKHVSLDTFLKSCASFINEHANIDHAELTNLVYHEIRSMMACKAAIKAGDVLESQQMHELVNKLHQTENRMTCPHGRPTLWTVSMYDLEKKFKRVG